MATDSRKSEEGEEMMVQRWGFAFFQRLGCICLHGNGFERSITRRM